MHKIALLLAAACAFGLGPVFSRLGPIAGPSFSITLAILLACAASGDFGALAITAGALGAFGSGVVEVASASIAGACLVGFAFAERTARVRDPAAKAVHVIAAVIGGALAGTLSSAYASASFALRAVAILVSTVLVALPLLVEADDISALSLEKSALALRDPVARALREGAQLRRQVGGAILDRGARLSVARTWRSLLRLADARVQLERARQVRVASTRVDEAATLSPTDSVVTMLDLKIREHVAALVRAYAAVDAAHAAELGLDDIDARSVDAVGETMEDVSRAIMEVKM